MIIEIKNLKIKKFAFLINNRYNKKVLKKFININYLKNVEKPL